MPEYVRLLVLENDVVQIGDLLLSDRNEIGAAMRKIFNHDQDTIFLIEPRAEIYYKGVGKIIYGSQLIGLPLSCLLYKNEDGEIINFPEPTE